MPGPPDKACVGPGCRRRRLSGWNRSPPSCGQARGQVAGHEQPGATPGDAAVSTEREDVTVESLRARRTAEARLPASGRAEARPYELTIGPTSWLIPAKERSLEPPEPRRPRAATRPTDEPERLQVAQLMSVGRVAAHRRTAGQDLSIQSSDALGGQGIASRRWAGLRDRGGQRSRRPGRGCARRAWPGCG